MFKVSLLPSPGPALSELAISLTAASSGSNGISVPDNVQLDDGTSSFSRFFDLALPDYTPGAAVVLYHKHDGTNGVIIEVLTSGLVRTTLNAATFDSSTAVTVTDGNRLKLGVAVTRETASVAGQVEYTQTGGVLGTNPAITAGTPTTTSNAVAGYLLGTSTTRTSGIVRRFIPYNRALSSSEVLSLCNNGIDPADVGGSNALDYNSDFATTVNGWVNVEGMTITANETVLGDTGWLKIEVNNIVGPPRAGRVGVAPFIARTAKRQFTKIELLVYIPAATTADKIFLSPWHGSEAGTTRFEDRNAVVAFDLNLLARDVVHHVSVEVIGRNFITDDLYIWMVTGESVGDVIYIKDLKTNPTGATLSLLPEGITPGSSTWTGSANGIDATLPAAGATIVQVRK